MWIKYFFAAVILIFVSCEKKKYKNPHIEIQTNAGSIEVELYMDKAPVSAGAFLSYIDSGFYKNAAFYRVLNEDNQPTDAFKAALIQGGIWRTNHKLFASLHGIKHETTSQTGILHKDVTISLARQEPGTATTEFFICIGDQPGFDYGGENNLDKQGYAAFGKVIKGMNVIKIIYSRPEDDEAFTPPVIIYNIVRL